MQALVCLFAGPIPAACRAQSLFLIPFYGKGTFLLPGFSYLA